MDRGRGWTRQRERGGGEGEEEGIWLLTIKRSLGSPRNRAVEQSTAAHLNTNFKCLHTRALQPAPTLLRRGAVKSRRVRETSRIASCRCVSPSPPLSSTVFEKPDITLLEICFARWREQLNVLLTHLFLFLLCYLKSHRSFALAVSFLLATKSSH